MFFLKNSDFLINFHEELFDYNYKYITIIL